MRLFALFFAICFFSACQVEEGKGGRATIQGKVFVDDYNQDGMLVVSDYIADWDVYIVYGDDETYGDVTTTHFDGTYQFDFLYEGNYTIYTYTKCTQCPNNIQPVIIEVQINEPDELVILPDLMIVD